MILLTFSLATSAFGGVLLNLYAASDTRERLHLLNYYTIHTNLIIGTTAILRLVYAGRIPPWLEGLTAGACLWILITGAVYHFLLARLYTPEGCKALANHLLHYVTPGLALVYYMLLPLPALNPLFYWLSYPLIYAFASLLRGALTGYYPYWFLRPTGAYPEGNGSYLRVMGTLLLMTVLFALAGGLLWLASHLISYVRGSY